METIAGDVGVRVCTFVVSQTYITGQSHRQNRIPRFHRFVGY